MSLVTGKRVGNSNVHHEGKRCRPSQQQQCQRWKRVDTIPTPHFASFPLYPKSPERCGVLAHGRFHVPGTYVGDRFFGRVKAFWVTIILYVVQQRGQSRRSNRGLPASFIFYLLLIVGGCGRIGANSGKVEPHIIPAPVLGLLPPVSPSPIPLLLCIVHSSFTAQLYTALTAVSVRAISAAICCHRRVFGFGFYCIITRRASSCLFFSEHSSSGTRSV